ncbi:hypothetical protein [Chryseobacterium sp. POL2]|uniref:hypothetical protein n=1 Tax=Chryseobacterium sp. POL2 TaxID=2713414 RepID=UPI0013E1189C|nr:hypothetical protein [Chryseobacterium sp. POL2]QIG88996.1 hypothetical protein G6R40_04630 [Chryseobacterium sp. POL2]
MGKKKKREFLSSELVQSFAKIHGFESKLQAFEIKDFLEDYLSADLFNEIESVNIDQGNLLIKIKSPLLKNDFRLRKSFYLSKIKNSLGENFDFKDLLVL